MKESKRAYSSYGNINITNNTDIEYDNLRKVQNIPKAEKTKHTEKKENIHVV